MRLIRVTDSDGNIYTLDIDDTTAIGIDFQAYDFKEPAKRKVNISNSFTVPATIQNLKIFGYPGNVHTRSKRFYDNWYVDYWIDNVHFVKNARLRIESVDMEAKRISLFIFEKPAIWDQFKEFMWPDFIAEFLVWMRDEKSLPVMVGGSSTHEFGGSMNAFLASYIGNTEGITLPHLKGNMRLYYDESSSSFVEREWNPADFATGVISLYLYDEVGDDKFYIEGGHFCIFIKTIFEFLEYKYSVNFYTAGGVFGGNIWDDVIISKVYTPARDISVYANDDFNVWAFFKRNDSFPGYFDPHHDAEDKPDKSMYDFIFAVFNYFNIIAVVDEQQVNIKLRRFDEIQDYGRVKNWSGLAKKPSFKPFVDGWAQNNYVKFASVYDGGDPYLNSKNIVCKNLSLDNNEDIIEVDCYMPSVTALYNTPCIDLEASFETFQFFVNSTSLQTKKTSIRIFNRANTVDEVEYIFLYNAQLIALNTEYQLLESALEYPEFYEVEKWLSLQDMVNYDPYNLYYFQEVNGTCYINKISGFNPEKSKEPTKIELIKINNSSPDPVYITDYWTDGVDDDFMDGEGDYYY